MLQTPSKTWIYSVRTEFEVYLSQKIQGLNHVTEGLHQAMQYGLLGAGKRLRACLVFAAGQAVGLDVAKLMDSACAIEAMHAYSLVHDDMPCMDNDVLRRGKPTCHVKFGEGMALLAGDALQTTAFQWLLDSGLLPDAVRLQQAAVLARAAGAQGMVNGQTIDVVNVGKPLTLEQLKYMHACKTGELIKASVRLGYLANPDLPQAFLLGLEHYAENLGLAYQVIDDILDVESTSEELGKTSGKDALSNKPTIVSLMGLAPAKQLLADLRHEAIAACEPFDEEQSKPLLELVDLITNRKS